jgi:hypothetical protein
VGVNGHPGGAGSSGSSGIGIKWDIRVQDLVVLTEHQDQSGSAGSSGSSGKFRKLEHLR